MRAYLTRHDVALRWVRQACEIGKIRSCYDVASADTAVSWNNDGLPNVWLGVSAERQQEADERIPLLLATPAAVRFVSLEPLLGPIDLTRTAVAPCITDARYHVWNNALKGETMSDHPICRGDVPAKDAWLDWVIVGGESGPNARPMHPDWARSLHDQCEGAGVPFFFKQWGVWAPVDVNPDGSYEYIGEVRLVAPSGQSVARADIERSDLPNASHLMERVGKKNAGRLLDGEEYNGFPSDARVIAPRSDQSAPSPEPNPAAPK